MKSRWGWVLLMLLAAPQTLRAIWRVYRHRSLSLEDQVDHLRRVPHFRGRFLNQPQNWRLVAHWSARLAPFLPGGLCHRESLLLLDLWSRCGLQPRLSLGVQKQGQHRRYHAWITTHEGFETASRGHQPFWSG